MDYKALTIYVGIEEDEHHTDARAQLEMDDRGFAGFGRARRNPTDPNVPMVGEELALARALYDLSHRMMEEASRIIEEHEQKPVHLEV